jgi:hypothetical protein
LAAAKLTFCPRVKQSVERRFPLYEKEVLPHTHIYNFSRKPVRPKMERGGRVEFVGLTGWHTRTGQLLRLIANSLEAVSLSTIGLAPGQVVIGRPSPALPE